MNKYCNKNKCIYAYQNYSYQSYKNMLKGNVRNFKKTVNLVLMQ